MPFLNTNAHFFLADWDTRDSGVLPGTFDTGYLPINESNWIDFVKTPHGWHGMSVCHLSLNMLLAELSRLHADPEFVRMTRKRGYATLEFRSKEEANWWRDKNCYLVKFQRVQELKQPHVGIG